MRKLFVKIIVLSLVIGCFSPIVSAKENSIGKSTSSPIDELNPAGKTEINNDSISEEVNENGDKVVTGEATYFGLPYNIKMVEKEDEGIKEITLHDGTEEINAIYYIDKGEIWMNGELVANHLNGIDNYLETGELDESLTTNKPEPQFQTLATKKYTIGSGSQGSGVYTYQSNYRDYFNMGNATVNSIAVTLTVLFFTKNKGAAAITGVAAAILAAFGSLQFTVYFSVWKYKDSKRPSNKPWYMDSINYYKTNSYTNPFVNVTHYYGWLI